MENAIEIRLQRGETCEFRTSRWWLGASGGLCLIPLYVFFSTGSRLPQDWVLLVALVLMATPVYIFFIALRRQKLDIYCDRLINQQIVNQDHIFDFKASDVRFEDIHGYRVECGGKGADCIALLGRDGKTLTRISGYLSGYELIHIWVASRFELR